MHVAFGAELLTRTARGAILGRDVPFDIPDDILTRLDKLEQAGCYDAIGHGDGLHGPHATQLLPDRSA